MIPVVNLHCCQCDNTHTYIIIFFSLFLNRLQNPPATIPNVLSEFTQTYVYILIRVKWLFIYSFNCFPSLANISIASLFPVLSQHPMINPHISSCNSPLQISVVFHIFSFFPEFSSNYLFYLLVNITSSHDNNISAFFFQFCLRYLSRCSLFFLMQYFAIYLFFSIIDSVIANTPF